MQTKKRTLTQRQIQAFRAIMLRGTMTAAAEELHTSQPSISRLIQELEAATGLILFSRNAGRLQVTDSGTAFYREVELSFVGLEKLTHIAREIAHFGTGRLRIAAAPVMALSVLPAVICRFRESFPTVRISLEMRSEATIHRWASSAYCDIGFPTAAPDTIGLHVEPLYQAAGVCAIPTDHPLAQKRKIMAKHLDGCALILPSYADITRSILDHALDRSDVINAPIIETPYGSTICALVSKSVGVGIVNPLAASSSPDGVVFRPFSPDIFFSGFAIYPNSHKTNPMVQSFHEMTREHIREVLSKTQGE